MPSGAQDAGESPALMLRRLLPPGPPTTVEQLVEELDRLGDLLGRGLDLTDRMSEHTPRVPRSRPHVLLNMVSTADGRSTLGGRSGRIGGQADRELFHGLRTVVDAVMVGAGTVRAERYRRLVRDEHAIQARRKRGLAEQPLACIVSGHLALDCEIPLLADPGARVAIVTSSEASLPEECRAEIDYVRATRDGLLDLPSALSELHERLAVGTLLCEGGPHLNSQLLAEGLVDELFLSLSPKLAGGDATEEALRILSGPELDPPATLELVGVSEHDSHLFLRYRVDAS